MLPRNPGLIILTAFLFARLSFAERPDERLATTEVTLTFRPRPNVPEYQFVLEGIDEFSAKMISVFRITKGRKTLIQTLSGPENSGGVFELADGRPTWRVEDLSFDGCLDVGIRWSRGATGNTLYYYWIFEPNTGRFKFSELLSDAMNIEVDKRRRILVSRPLHQFGYEEFKFKKGRFVKIKSVSNKEALKHVEIH